MPPRRRNRNKNRNRTSGSSVPNGTKAGANEFVRTSLVNSRADTNFDSGDIVARPPSIMLREHPPKNLRNQIYWFRYGQASTYAVPAGPTVGQFSKTFYLNDVFNAVDLGRVFDQYCIYGIIVSFIPSAAANSAGDWGMVTSVIDYTDTQNLTTSSEALAYSTSRTSTCTPGKAHTRYLEPCVSQAIYTSVANSYGPVRAWVDILNPACPHFGLKALFYNNTLSYSCEVNTEYLIGFRSSK